MARSPRLSLTGRGKILVEVHPCGDAARSSHLGDRVLRCAHSTMARRQSPLLRRILFGFLGLLPFIGAFVSLALGMTSIHWSVDGVGASSSAVLHALAGYVVSPIGAIVLIQAGFVGLQCTLWQRY